MTPKEKFNDIDFSKVPEKAQIAANTIKPVLLDKKYQAEQYTDARKQAESQMNALYDKLLKSYPDSIKSKAAKKPEPKTPQAMAVQAAQATIKQPTVKKPKATAGANNRGNVAKLAKEIRKEGEAWHAAVKRAGEMVNKEKGKAVKKANAQYEKLKAFLAKNPTIEKTMVTFGKKPNQGTRPLDVRRDASRIAKPKGKRISADGKTYYEYRANRTDSSRKRYPYLELGGKLFGAGSFADGGYMAKGEDYEYYNKFGLEQSDFEKIVEVWHMHEKTPTVEVEKQYNMVMDAMEDKYGEAKIDDVVDDIYHRHGFMKIMNYAKGGNIRKITFADLYPKIVQAVMKDIKVSKEKAEKIVNQNEAYLTDMIEAHEETNVSVLADIITTSDDGEYAKGGKLKTPTNKEVCDNGEIIEEDISDKRNKMETVIEYNKELYLVDTNYVAHGKNKKSLQPTQPNRTAKKLVEPDKDGNYVVEFYGENMKKPIVSKSFTTFKSAIKFANNQDNWNDETYDFDIIVYGNSGKILAKKYFSAIGIYDEDEDKYDEFWEKVKSMKGVSNIEVTVGVAEYRRKKIATHNFKTTKEAEQFISDISYEGRLDAYIHDIPIDLIVNIYDLSDMDIYANGGMFGAGRFAKGGEITPELHAQVLNRTHDIYIEMGGTTKDDFDIALDKAIIEFGYNPEEYHLTMQQIGAEFDIDIDDDKYSKGGKMKGKLSSKYNYVPNYMIQEVEVERKGKTTFIDAANILDGVYVKKGVKYATGGYMGDMGFGRVSLPVRNNIDASDINAFIDRLVLKYGIDGEMAAEFNGGFTNEQIEAAVQQYLAELKESKTWSFGYNADEAGVLLHLTKHNIMAHGGTMPHVHSKKHKNG